MWDWVDVLGAVILRAGIAATVLSSLTVLALLGCRQPARRIALARPALLSSLLLIPLAAFLPLPRFPLIDALKAAGILPHPLLSLALEQVSNQDPVVVPGATGPGPDALLRSDPAVVGSWPSRLFVGLYLVGVGACLSPLIVGYWGLGWLTRNSTRASPRAQALYDALPFSDGRLGLRPRLRVSMRVGRPVLLGTLRPTILIPPALDADLEAQGTNQSLRLSLLHELAHAERLDPCFSLLGCLAQAFWFFLPPVWWIRARMHLDHELLADRRAAIGFGPPQSYASSLVALAEPEGDQPRPPGRTSSVGSLDSPLFHRILMLISCPFPVEHRPPSWWRWPLPALSLVLPPAILCLCLDLGAGPPTRPLTRPPQTFQVARLALDPQQPGPQGRATLFELPFNLPEQFDLTLEIWGDPARLAGYRVVGQRLGPASLTCHSAAEPHNGPESWHRVRLEKRPHRLFLQVDGQPVPCDPGLTGLTSRLTIEPVPDCRVLVRHLRVTW